MPEIQQEVYRAVREATNSVFSTMLSREVTPEEPKELVDPPPLTGVMALLGFTGEWAGLGMVYCQEKLAIEVSSTMLMCEVTEVTNDVLDAMGEVANMVIGNVKDLLQPTVGTLAMSIPTVIYGRNFQARTTQHRHWLIQPFQSGGAAFEVRICLTPKENGAG